MKNLMANKLWKRNAVVATVLLFDAAGSSLRRLVDPQSAQE